MTTPLEPNTPPDPDTSAEASEPKPAQPNPDSERLRAELAEVLEQLAYERSRADSAEQRATELQAERDEPTAERDRAREELTTATQRGDELALQLKKAAEEHEALQVRLEAETSLRETAERERDQAQTSLTAEVAAHANTQRALKAERMQRVVLEGQLIQLREANAELESRLKSANANIRSLETKLKVVAGIGALGTAANFIPRK